jgi:pimeloyl-ACP methyl ester carboxylesterase
LGYVPLAPGTACSLAAVAAAALLVEYRGWTQADIALLAGLALAPGIWAAHVVSAADGRKDRKGRKGGWGRWGGWGRDLALDCRGHGRSDKPHAAASYGNEMIEDVARLMDHLDIRKAHIVGRARGSGR